MGPVFVFRDEDVIVILIPVLEWKHVILSLVFVFQEEDVEKPKNAMETTIVLTKQGCVCPEENVTKMEDVLISSLYARVIFVFREENASIKETVKEMNSEYILHKTRKVG